VIRDELITTEFATTNSAPAIAIDSIDSPHVFYSKASNGFSGFYARRASGGFWNVEATPMTAACGSIVIQSDDTAHLLSHNGNANDGDELWTLSGGQWQKESVLNGWGTSAGTFVRAHDECHYALLTQLGSGMALARLDQTGWSFFPYDDFSLYGGVDYQPIAIGPSGHLHTARWRFGSGYTLEWLAPPGSAEAVVETDYYVPDVIKMTVTGSGGPTEHPHIVANRRVGDEILLTYATRTEPGEWVLLTVDQGEATGYDPPCATPTKDGEYCSYNATMNVPFAVVSNGLNEVRILYNRRNITGGAYSHCHITMPSGTCDWGWVTDYLTVDGELAVAWPEGNVIVSTAIQGVDWVGTGSATVDSAGRIHLAVYDKDQMSWNYRVRYFLLGAVTP